MSLSLPSRAAIRQTQALAGPSPEHRFACGVVNVARRNDPVIEHWLAMVCGGN
jgi:hypothetical protein